MPPKKKKKKNSPAAAKRVSFPDDEKKHRWLTLLLDGYQIVDRGVAKAIDTERKKGRELACAKGCSNCCSTHSDIPVYPLEIVGILWYTTEIIAGPVRQKLKKQLADFKKGGTCPFMLEGVCEIHRVRPMACRQFNVFDRPCEEGEDPFHTRREDVMDPVKKHIDQAFFIMLPYYGVKDEKERIKVIETGAFHNMVKELHACNWNELAGKMDRAEKR